MSLRGSRYVPQRLDRVHHRGAAPGDPLRERINGHSHPVLVAAVGLPGFKKFVLDNVKVAVDENRRVDVQFQVGAVSESVTVQAEAVQVETRSGSLREVIDSSRIVQLPLNGRNPLQLQ